MNVTEAEPINYQRIEQAIAYLEQNFLDQPSLDEIAEKVHISPFHFQRMFTEWAGISPKRFLQYLTVSYLKKKLEQSKNLTDAAADAGLSAQSRVYDLFTSLEAVTPLEYKTGGEGITISYGFHETRFGRCVIGVTRRGVCWLSFLKAGESDEAAVSQMQDHWTKSKFSHDPDGISDLADTIFSAAEPDKKLRVLVKGTNFQVKVWDALLRIPEGNVSTYQQIASAIGNPNALQAVGSAVGANHVAYLIPCHRVIRKDGILGEYRWTPARKKIIIGWEMGAAERRQPLR